MPGERALLIGLGNPGLPYAGNRHNVGAMIIEVLAARLTGRFRSHKAGAQVAECRLGAASVVLARPSTYMNLSGGPVAGLMRFYKAAPGDLVVLHDDLDLPFCTIRVKQGGGEGGHNGLRSISSAIGSRDFLRVRFGIGRPPGRMDPADYVLRDFSAAEGTDLPVGLEEAADAAEMLITEGLLATQNRLH